MKKKQTGIIGKLLPGSLALALLMAAPAPAGRICFEAEDAVAVEPPMRVVRAGQPPEDGEFVTGASGDAYLEIPAGSGNPPEVNAGKAVYELDIRNSGFYYMWARVYWENECSNSVYAQINDGPRFVFGQTGNYKAWHWVRSPPRLSVLNLERGRHRLTLHNREDGIRVDQILLTRNRRLVPVDKEPVTEGAVRQ